MAIVELLRSIARTHETGLRAMTERMADDYEALAMSHRADDRGHRFLEAAQ